MTKKIENENEKIKKCNAEIVNLIDTSFLHFLKRNFTKRTFTFYLIIIFVNIISLLIKFSIGLYGYSGKKYL